MKIKRLVVEHNGQTLEMDLLVPLSSSAIDRVVHEAKEEIARIRQGYKDLEDKLRAEYANKPIDWR